MAPTLFHRVLVDLLVLVAAVGTVDALVGRAFDHVVLHGIVLAGLLVLLVRSSRGRRLVPVRGDLYSWLDRYAAEGDEELERVVDRALSAYRDGFTVPAER